MPRTIHELDQDEQQAIKAYVAKHGRTWRAKLANAWGMGTDTREPNGSALRGIRNNPRLGHDWLDRVKL